MSTPTHLLFLAGSSRADSLNKKLAHIAADVAGANGITATFADLGDYPMPLYDGDLEDAEGVPDNAIKLHDLFLSHSGIFIASPEYNAGITPLLKNTLDWVSRVRIEGLAPLEVYKTRIFMVASASPGHFGGIRGLIMLKQIMATGLGAVVLPDQLAIPNAHDAFDAEGRLQDLSHLERLKVLIQKLYKSAKMLQAEG